MLALYGAGFFVALQQICVVYYVACIFIHWVIPRALPVQNIQVQSRQPGQVRREALASQGEYQDVVCLSIRKAISMTQAFPEYSATFCTDCCIALT